jgi:hypothetical protein
MKIPQTAVWGFVQTYLHRFNRREFTRLLGSTAYSHRACVSYLTVRAHPDSASTHGKVVWESKSDLSKVCVGYEAHIFRRNVVRLIIAVNQSDYSRSGWFTNRRSQVHSH